jgi:hypothetical protein
MGGEWRPKQFASLIPDMWKFASNIIHEDDGSGYLFSSITLASSNKLEIREGNSRTQVDASDRILEIFDALKKAGDDSAIIVDRESPECFLTNKESCDWFMKERVEIEDGL